MNSDCVHRDLTNKDYVEWLSFLRKSESWSSVQIAEHQFKELKRVMQHAYENTVGYRELYKRAGLSPDSLRTPEDLSKFPFVEKEMLRDRLDDFSVQSKNRSYVTTGGSTGIPFGMYRNPEAFPRELASKAHQYHRIGWREGDRQFVLRGVPIDSHEHMEFVAHFNELRCSSYHLTPEWMEKYRKKALQYQPQWLRCYPSAGHLFARFLKETGRRFPQLKGILCASENLYDYQKELLSDVFDTRVFSHYGHYELAVLAGFCEHRDTYHVLPQYGLAELLDERGLPVEDIGGIGEIVGTSFLMNASPIIRYRTRDLAVFAGWGCPSCRRPYQIWERIEGRLQEFIVSGSGRRISMTAMNMHDEIFDHIKQFQFHQQQQGLVNFEYIPKTTFTKEIEETIRRRLLGKLGTDLDLKMQQVAVIPLTPRGKHRMLRQELSVEFSDE